MTWLPSGRMKSGLLMSMPSAIHATLTPVPSTMFCACGVDLSRYAVCVVCNASGSSNGFDGSDGQLVDVSVAVADVPAALPVVSNVGRAIGRSGRIAATAGFAATADACAAVMLAAKPLTKVKPRTFRAPNRFASASSGAWSCCAARTRADELLLPIAKLVCWSRSKTMTFCADAFELAGLGAAAADDQAIDEAAKPATSADASSSRVRTRGMITLLRRVRRSPLRVLAIDPTGKPIYSLVCTLVGQRASGGNPSPCPHRTIRHPHATTRSHATASVRRDASASPRPTPP